MASDKKTAADERKAAEERVREAQEKLQKAQQEAAEAGVTLSATVLRDVPEMEVEVLPGNVVAHGGETYEEGDSFTLEGPTALAQMQAGHVKIKGAK